ncbi:MAG: MurT ligase domain-containing protein [Acidimicrobiia bacterium]
MARPAPEAQRAYAPEPMSGRGRLAMHVARAVNGALKKAGRSHGTVGGGKLALGIEPHLIAQLGAGRPVTVISGTNGKTTTTRMIAAAVGAQRSVAFTRGANLPQGMIGPLSEGTDEVVLEVDELWVPRIARELHASVLVLLNISRDQLDRMNETKRIAGVWKNLIESCDWPMVVVANADDPLIVWAVGGYRHVVWVGAATAWDETSVICPACGELWDIAPPGPWRSACGLERPAVDWRVDGNAVIGPKGERVDLGLQLPGACNQVNAATALAAAAARGIDLHAAAPALNAIESVNGRFIVRELGPHRVHMLLVKNLASWMAMVDFLGSEPWPIVFCVNGRGADGHDTSWLWDLPLDVLVGRTVIAGGERRLDLAVCLEVAGVDPQISAEPVKAIASLPPGDVVIVATYTAFHALLEELDVRW